MLSMATLFHGPPGQQPEPGALDFPRSPQKLPSASEAESEASMSEASSEDLVLPLEVAPGRESDKAAKKEKKKKSRGLASVFSVFTKGRKKKPQPSSAEAEGEPEPRPQLADRLPTGTRQGAPGQSQSESGGDWGSWDWMTHSPGPQPGQER